MRHTFKSLLSGVDFKWCFQLTIASSGTTESVIIQYHKVEKVTTSKYTKQSVVEKCLWWTWWWLKRIENLK